VLPAGLTQASVSSTADVERNLQLLSDPDERNRAAAAIQLGRMRSQRAIDPLAATLAGDRSANVRETAARALGIIGSAKALPALQNAALNDSDRDVRHSAQFAVEIVQSGR
jgi:HEAT repeat protein